MTKRDHYQAVVDLRNIEAELAAQLDLFGDELASRYDYPDDVKGMDAIYFFLMERHHWFPSQVRAMSWEDLQFALAGEMSGWHVPKELCDVYPSRRTSESATDVGATAKRKSQADGEKRTLPK